MILPNHVKQGILQRGLSFETVEVVS